MSQAGRTILRVPLRVISTPYGRAASEALRGEIARAKQESPLAPVTVIVPGNSVGIAVRRLLASGEMGPVSSAGVGLIGVNFLTASRLAELLAAPRLAAAKRRPASTPVVAAAVRRVLATSAGMFAPVATHPATEEALVAATGELSDLEDGALSLLAEQSERAREVVRIHRLVKGHLDAAWYDEHDLMRAACDVAAEGGALVRELGTVVCHLPQRMSAPVARLLRAVAERNELVVIAGLTGVPKSDAEVVASVERLGGTIDLAASDVVPARGRPARADGGGVREHRALRAAAARSPGARRHRAQRRLGANARRFSARPLAVAPPRARRR